MKLNLKKFLLLVFLLMIGIGKFHPVRGTNTSIFTISVWVKPSTSAASKAIVGKAEELRVATNASGQPVCQIKSSSAWQTAATSSAAISVGSWAHIVCTYDLAYVRIYVNGVEKGSQALSVAADDTAAVWKIGRDDSGSTPYGYFAGQIDEYKFFNSALTPEQVKLDMNQGKSVQFGGQTSATGATGQAAEYCIPGDTASCAGPVGEWKFDEKEGMTANDTSGNGHDGTWISTGSWTRGRFGSAGNMTASNYPRVADSDDWDIASSGGTMEFWFKANTIQNGTFNNLLCHQPGSSSGWCIYLHNPDGRIAAFANGSNAGGVSPLTNFFDDQWHYVSFVVDTSISVAFLYIDGGFTGSDSFSGLIDADSVYLAIGGGGFRGSIDQVRIFHYARTPAQIAWDYNRGKPVGWWKLDEGEGTSAYDSSGNSNTGTLTSMDPPNDWVDGKFGKGLDFAGDDDYISTAISYSNPQDFSVSAWFKTSSASGKKIVGFENLQTGSSSSYDRHLYVDTSGNVRFGCYNGGCYYATSTGTYNNNQWHLATATHKASDNVAKLYIDGVYQSTFTSACQSYTGYWRIGSYKLASWANGSDGYFPGQIDDVRVYNYTLTAEQVKQVMNEGSAIRFGD